MQQFLWVFAQTVVVTPRNLNTYTVGIIIHDKRHCQPLPSSEVVDIESNNPPTSEFSFQSRFFPFLHLPPDCLIPPHNQDRMRSNLCLNILMHFSPPITICGFEKQLSGHFIWMSRCVFYCPIDRPNGMRNHGSQIISISPCFWRNIMDSDGAIGQNAPILDSLVETFWAWEKKEKKTRFPKEASW